MTRDVGVRSDEEMMKTRIHPDDDDLRTQSFPSEVTKRYHSGINSPDYVPTTVAAQSSESDHGP